LNNILLVLLIAGGAAYLILLGMVIGGLIRLKREEALISNGDAFPTLSPLQAGGDTSSVSVIIAARNEAQWIEHTLTAIIAQDYPADKLEIIVVDDRSEDDTAAIIERVASQDHRVKLVRQRSIIPGRSPKKQALAAGIAASSGEIIVTTDADTLPRTEWLRALIGRFTPEVGMVAGQARFIGSKVPEFQSDKVPKFQSSNVLSFILHPSSFILHPIDGVPLWQRLQALDFASQGIAAAGLIGAGVPFSCSGASLAFQRRMYDEIGGWTGVERLVSGDDELLMQKAHRAGWKIAAAISPDAVVATRPPKSLRELWHQRARWGSKGLYYNTPRRLLLAGVYLFCLALIISAAADIFLEINHRWALFWVGKATLDGAALALGARFFGDRINPVQFLITELLHPLMIVVFPLAGHFGTFEWKGGRYRSAAAAQ